MLVAFAAAVALAIAAFSSKLSDCFSYSLGVVFIRLGGCSGSSSGGGAGGNGTLV